MINQWQLSWSESETNGLIIYVCTWIRGRVNNATICWEHFIHIAVFMALTSGRRKYFSECLNSLPTNMKVKPSKSSSLDRVKACKWISVLIIVIFNQFHRAVAEDYGSILGAWRVQYGNDESFNELHLWTSSKEIVPLVIYNVTETDNQNLYFEIESGNPKLVSVKKKLINITEFESSSSWQGEFVIEGLHFGYTDLYVTLNDPLNRRIEYSRDILKIILKREKGISDNTLTYIAAAIALLMFVNLGTVLDLKRVATIFTRPIGPLLGICCRYVIMPGLALGLGALMFKDNQSLQLALFFTALTPSGGIANICNIFLKGNINLSLATTTVNSLLALGMLPLWIYLLGPVLYENQEFDLPFVKLAVGCVGLCIALIVGVILRLCIPKTTRFIFRFLKPLSIILSLCLIALTVGFNYFIFQEITFMIFLAAFCLCVLGYVLSFVLSKLLCRTATDSMTIAIETSVLNMTLPIVLLEYTMEQPMTDMLIVVPITAALVSLCLVVVFYIVRRIFGWNSSTDPDCFDEQAFLVEQ
ncbi:sodium/bile acid cotransporter 5 [Haematobia irritans]|uniref:sodium/bile acid cotransporter 5 n=1 Tax=Haematobia irritans TaxID=7368 RepID=UPI003F50814D